MNKIGLIAPYEQVDNERIKVESLTEPIEIVLPLTIELDSSNPNRTLSCGYVDDTDLIFKKTGLRTAMEGSTATCKSSHLT